MITTKDWLVMVGCGCLIGFGFGVVALAYRACFGGLIP